MKNKKPNAELVWNNWKTSSRRACACRSSTVRSIRISCGTAAWKENSASGFRFWAGAQYPAIHGTGARGGAPPRRARCSAHGPAQQIGHVVEVRLPSEIRAVRLNRIESRAATRKKARAPARGESRGSGLSAQQAAAKGHPHARARPMLLLFAPDHASGAVPGPRRATGALGTQFLPQPGLELHGMQRQKGERPPTIFSAASTAERRLTATELAIRLRALDALASGKLRLP